MADRSEVEMRINGRATFAAAAYLIGVGLTFVLERIGAPDALVRNLGPSIALFVLALIGVLSRSSRMSAVFTADRLPPPIYAGAALAAIAAGFAIVFSTAQAGERGPLAAIPAGLLLGAVFFGPLARRSGASSLSDLLSARFPSSILRIVFALAYFAIGALIAAAGFESAVRALSSFVGVSRETSIAVIAVSAVLILIPGGLAGLLWAGAAAAGMIAAVFLAPILAHPPSEAGLAAPIWQGGAEAAAVLAQSWWQLDPRARALDAAAIAVGFSVIPPVFVAGLASANQTRAMQSGIVGVALAALLALAFFVALPLWPKMGNVAAAGLHGSAGLLAAVICASAGVHTASRAVAFEARGYGLQTVLASRRLAGTRQLAFLAVALSAVLSYRETILPSTALLGASALALVATGPSLALAASQRAHSLHALAAIVVSLGAIVGLAELQGWVFVSEHAPAASLAAAAAGFAVGWAASLFVGGRTQSGVNGAQTLFVEPPPDPGV
jgi:cation/acetate symporter